MYRNFAAKQANGWLFQFVTPNSWTQLLKLRENKSSCNCCEGTNTIIITFVLFRYLLHLLIR